MLTQLLTGTSIHRTWIPFEDISPALVRAVIVSEDGRFCEHGGIDTQAMRQAIERASGGTPRGASTISMQLTKNLFLFNAKSYLRKVVEIPLTLIMELLWPKRRILEVYLNVAEWGPGVFGAEAAARHHFGKPAASLDQREAALLAAVLPNPVQRVAGAPGPQTSRKARVIQSRVKAYGAVASCVVAPAASTPPAAKTPTLRKPQPLRTQPKKQRPQKKPADDWAPILNFGN
jgi:monofunctional biosynthetic peptidoglycan transglycosylase